MITSGALVPVWPKNASHTCTPAPVSAAENSASPPQTKINAMLTAWFFQRLRFSFTPHARFSATSSGKKMPLAVNSSSSIESHSTFRRHCVIVSRL